MDGNAYIGKTLSALMFLVPGARLLNLTRWIEGASPATLKGD